MLSSVTSLSCQPELFGYFLRALIGIGFQPRRRYSRATSRIRVCATRAFSRRYWPLTVWDLLLLADSTILCFSYLHYHTAPSPNGWRGLFHRPYFLTSCRRSSASASVKN